METAHALSTGQPALSLSEQQLISCDFHPGREDMNEGCKGGYWWKAMDYSINNGGLNTEENYPYLGRDATCDFEKAKKDNKGFLSGYEFIDTLNETAMIATVANQPTLIEVCVGDDYIKYWQLYKSGVYDIAGCYDTIDHGMLVVGFDLDAHNGTGAWTIKNSWGEGWGEAGYMRAAMGLGPEPVPGKIRGIFNMYHRPARPFISKSKVINTLKLGRSELRSVYVSQL